jgi:hypothetical protein
MKKFKMEIVVNAPKETVWDSIINLEKYKQWASAFEEGSYFEGSWNKGDSIRFVALNKQGMKEGMVSEIAESQYPTYISIRHLGYIFNGVEDTTSEEIKKWAPSYENYTLERIDSSKTIFKLEMDITEEFYEIFVELWPKALSKLKKVSEAN